MVAIKIKETTKQAKAVIEMLKTFSFVEFESTSLKRPVAKTAIQKSLDEIQTGKIKSYKNSTDLFKKVLNV